ncbi:PIG-L family deacetylase [Streptomyces sp. FXJ1.172]|uniref:PIG-L deacetylase family protein n=1 Tax=Streptomyces sp. FXJ1.172 TaxID=710705 RepID=UPI0007CF6454|nr:PIG-L family deacetylase [Streptomyces sp. FXJ1.172]WEO94714.1 PIG-L family deacetylase [Streptomyces sp. FXJ1.172]
MASTVLVVSPHLDDAVLSAGGRIHRLVSEGAHVTVFTVFAGIPEPPYSPIAEYFHYVWGLDTDPVEHRRREDQAAVALLGATPSYGSFLDAVYRRRPDGSWLVDMDQPAVQGHDVPEPALGPELETAVASLLGTLQPDLVLTCAAVGNHLDHRRARDAVAAAAAGKVPLYCWEDLPYGMREPDPPPLPAGAGFGPPVAETASERAWSAKYAAIGCYRSQHSMLWPPGTDVRELFDTHAAGRAGAHGADGRAEVFWPVEPGGA